MSLVLCVRMTFSIRSFQCLYLNFCFSALAKTVSEYTNFIQSSPFYKNISVSACIYIYIYSLVVISLFPLSNQQKCHVPVILHTTVGNHNKWIFFHKADYSKLSNALTSSKSLKFIESLFELLLFVCLFVRSFYRSFTSQSLMHMRSLNNLKLFH